MPGKRLNASDPRFEGCPQAPLGVLRPGVPVTLGFPANARLAARPLLPAALYPPFARPPFARLARLLTSAPAPAPGAPAARQTPGRSILQA